MAKQVKEHLEFIKFFKNLYSDEISLNFDDYFIISNKDGAITVYFPENKYCKIIGELDISSMPSFKSWLLRKNSSVKIKSDELDELRKLKMSDFISVDYESDDSYYIYTNIKEYRIDRMELTGNTPEFDFKYNFEIPNERMDQSTITFYIDKDVISLEPSEASEVLLDAAINKNFQIIFKEPSEEKISKGATRPRYTIHATDKENGFRIVMIQCSGSVCTMKQYFRVI